MSRPFVPLPRWAVLAAAAWGLFVGAGCAMSKPSLRAPSLDPLPLEAAAPPVLEENHFGRDKTGAISEGDLRKVLEAPVFLEERSRIGVVPVAARYEPQAELPTAGVPGVLAEALEGTGLFELASEVSTDWPADRGIAGLRELAARYRADYLLIYRHRFVEQRYWNAWAAGYLTVVGTFFLPANTLESAGVLEATLFDVKTGTILFTVYERVFGASRENNWHNDLKMRDLQAGLLAQAGGRLSDQVVGKVRRLSASRPAVSPRPSGALSSRPDEGTEAPNLVTIQAGGEL